MNDKTSQELFYRVAIRNNLLLNLEDDFLRQYHLEKLEEDFEKLIIYLTKTAQFDILNQIKKNFNKED